MNESKAMDTPNSSEAGSRRTSKTLVTVLALIAVVLVLTWAVAVCFEIAIIKSLAAVIIVLFLIGIALLLAGIG